MQVVHIITSLNDGGAEATLDKLITQTAFSSPKYHVISLLDFGKYGQKFSELGIPTYSLNLNKPFYAMLGIFRLYKILRMIQPDLVQTWLYHADLIGGLLARFVGIRKVYWGVRHSNLSSKHMKIKTFLIVKISALMSKIIPHKIICCSQAAIESHINIGYDKKKFVLINNGYDLSVFSKIHKDKQSIRMNFSIPKDQPLLGMVARFDPQKDHHNLLKSLATVKNEGIDFIFILVGNQITTHNERLTNWINQLSLNGNVILLGPQNDISVIMNLLDIHVLSSLGEAFPNVIAEAMACSTPCISTNVGDASRIIGSTGWIVPPQNHSLLAKSIIEALNEFEDTKKWSLRKSASRKRIVDNYSLDKMVLNYLEAWNFKKC